MEKNVKRSLTFGEKQHNRFWWHRLEHSDFIPPIYSFLTDEEWSVLESWYEETEQKQLVGESAVPLMSLVQGLVMGSMIDKIVQLGTYSGYSTLLIAFMLRRMGIKNGLFTIDIDPHSSMFAESYIIKAGLDEYAKINIGDSADKSFVEKAKQYFGNCPPKMILIDSSHQYKHTVQELNIWFKALNPGGLLLLHDTSEQGQLYDPTRKGGVLKALEKWRKKNSRVKCLNINNRISTPDDSPNRVYKDGCGVAIIQKDDE